MGTAKKELQQNPGGQNEVSKSPLLTIDRVENENIRRELDIFSINEKINEYR